MGEQLLDGVDLALGQKAGAVLPHSQAARDGGGHGLFHQRLGVQRLLGFDQLFHLGLGRGMARSEYRAAVFIGKNRCLIRVNLLCNLHNIFLIKTN